ncbi:hypothetical protein AV521_03050 [Streptomyces sp. IMTB 2501]|uniref:hypothetical protein n=1 Tax=Streptomyces sp. IMTB 2501 TaxID=1776340 RepID=UPI00096C3284|nr:hypothetical protein [Streptomyces sp. IMTB 2501]OLZ74612.1 hypothetical protein AV521_03050 [Streptomyces sp. IMTB 2501]
MGAARTLAGTRERATEAGLRAAADLTELAERCAIVLSVCPPAAAPDVAASVAAAGFRGVYVDANAVSPQRMGEIGVLFTGVPVTLVDGGITGPPPRTRGTTRLYLSGEPEAVASVSALFDGTLLTPHPHAVTASGRCGAGDHRRSPAGPVP